MRNDYIVLYCKQEMDPINQQQFLDIITNPLTDEQRKKEKPKERKNMTPKMKAMNQRKIKQYIATN